MASSNHERVGKALELLVEGLRPYVEREMRAIHNARWLDEARPSFGPSKPGDGAINWDAQALVTVMWDQWHQVFSRKLGQNERNLISELRTVRNKWAHQELFSTDDAYRALDSTARLLVAVSADQAREVENHKQELLRIRFAEQTRRETRKTAAAPIEGQTQPGLRPWREIITPHPDVASGRYQQAEFAADLAQVHRGEGADEYRDPKEFFRRTFLTDGLRHLLVGAVRRLAGAGGDPVVELQTNFGGGKTHSLLALFHVVSGTPATELAGIEAVMQEAGVTQQAAAHRAVLVGTALSPGMARRKPDGTEVRTLWGELAWQLGGKDGYSLVADADAAGVSPGSAALRDLFEFFSPCLILIDEWVAYVRQVYGVDGLPAGSFGANMTFAQALTEAARQSSKALVVASIPSSDIEIGGEGGQAALDMLKNTFGRMESAWRPASAEEGFEIVRRRLFEPITDPQKFPLRDAVVRAFGEFYRSNPGDFPPTCREADYERRLQAAYPIHPELFDRLYNDWSTLDKFQRTRGVLRLMAAVIHSLWERQDSSALILPSSVPVDEGAVQFELTRYMEDPWVPVIETDVDGPASLPMELDRQNPNFGRYSACRRVARTLYLGSAPTLNTSQRGLEDRSIKLGCAQPGEQVGTFGDALRRLTDQATHLYVDGTRYWFSTQPSVTRLSLDRAIQRSADDVKEEIVTRLRAGLADRGDFARVHLYLGATGDIPDEREVRLVELGPDYPHSGRAGDSPARQAAALILSERGTASRTNKNTLIFLAPDRTRLGELDQAVRELLAWRSIEADKEQLNLDTFQSNQARTKRQQAEEKVTQRIPETYHWLLVPGQPDPQQDELEWQEIRLQGSDKLAVRASKKLKNEELLILEFAGTRLRMELDKIPLWRGDFVTVKQLAEDFAQYPYLARLKDSEVLVAAIRDGVGRMLWQQETFAYADSWDASTGRFIGLIAGTLARVTLDNQSVVVRPEIAAKQLEADAATTEAAQRGAPTNYQSPGGGNGPLAIHDDQRVTPETDESSGKTPASPPARRELRRFHGSVSLDPVRLSGDAGKVAEAIVQHLAGLMGANVRVTLEIEAEMPAGFPESVIRTVSENSRTLKFTDQGFEET